MAFVSEITLSVDRSINQYLIDILAQRFRARRRLGAIEGEDENDSGGVYIHDSSFVGTVLNGTERRESGRKRRDLNASGFDADRERSRRWSGEQKKMVEEARRNGTKRGRATRAAKRGTRWQGEANREARAR